MKYDTINKDLGSSTEREGLHSGPPGYEFIVFPSVFRSLEFSLKVGTVRRFSPRGLSAHRHFVNPEK